MTAAAERDHVIDYDRSAAEYARHRGVHPAVVRELIAGAAVSPKTNLLDVGCGTGNYARALQLETGCRVSGVEPSREMRERASAAASWDTLAEGSAELLPFGDDTFDLVFSTDVIHHVGDRNAFYRQAARVLRSGGKVATVTDSPRDIERRRPLSSHFPETIPIELERYPAIETLEREMTRAGFRGIETVAVAREYELVDAQPYRDRAFSSLLLIDDDVFQRGLHRLEQELAHGPVRCLSLYTIIWGTLSRASRREHLEAG